MKDTVRIFGRTFEYDFLSGWIKYNRMMKEISQDALAYGVCSASHLSYFESGKKRLRGEIIEALLKKLDINGFMEHYEIGLLRQRLYDLMLQIESFNYDSAEVIYKEISPMEDLINSSPYNIEYKIYQLLYNVFVEEKSYSQLEPVIKNLDRVYSTLNNDLQYLYMLVTGKLIYDFKNHLEGIDRLTASNRIKDTPWINYRLGVAYCLNDEPLKGTYFLEKALESYGGSGRYINALLCHDFLGMCYTSLGIYDKAEENYKAMLTGAQHFNKNKNLRQVYNNLSNLYLNKRDYDESMKWARIAMEIEDDPVLPAANYIKACTALGRMDECKEVFERYLREKYKDSRYYNLLYFLYLSIFHFKEELFYREVKNRILPYYENMGYIIICKPIKYRLIEYLEENKRYKEANSIYKEILT